MNQSSTEFALQAPTNAAGEDWTDAVRACADHNGNTQIQFEQALHRAQGLIVEGNSIARAVGIVTAKLRQQAKVRAGMIDIIPTKPDRLTLAMGNLRRAAERDLLRQLSECRIERLPEGAVKEDLLDIRSRARLYLEESS